MVYHLGAESGPFRVYACRQILVNLTSTSPPLSSSPPFTFPDELNGYDRWVATFAIPSGFHGLYVHHDGLSASYEEIKRIGLYNGRLTEDFKVASGQFCPDGRSAPSSQVVRSTVELWQKMIHSR